VKETPIRRLLNLNRVLLEARLFNATEWHVRNLQKTLNDRKMDDRKIAQWSEDYFSVIHFSVRQQSLPRQRTCKPAVFRRGGT
jgi:hypothetical protein